MKDLICKNCGNPREIGRRLCRPCNLQRLIDSSKDRPRYMFEKTCAACKKGYQAWRKEQELCRECYYDMKKLSAETLSSNNYVVKHANNRGRKFRHEHRYIAEQVLGRTLACHEIVHHMDDDPKNNLVTNLVVMTRDAHGRLHKYLDLQRVILEKSNTENFENCWKTLIVPITTAWLETASAKVIKIWEIGQSAAEHLKVETKGEGSETMHEAPATDNAVGDDIVQTTTATVG